MRVELVRTSSTANVFRLEDLIVFDRNNRTQTDNADDILALIKQYNCIPTLIIPSEGPRDFFLLDLAQEDHRVEEGLKFTGEFGYALLACKDHKLLFWRNVA